MNYDYLKELFIDEAIPALKRHSSSGGSNDSGDIVGEKDVKFYDYDGTLLYEYSADEIQAMTELPALPTRAGLICQGWNYDLDTIKSETRKIDVGAIYTTDDGSTRIYISLKEGRTNPMMGLSVNIRSTVTVDWGDGTEPDVLANTTSTKAKNMYTPNHEYSQPGDYVIRLTVNGEIGIIGIPSGIPGTCILMQQYSDTSKHTNYPYYSAIKKIEIGNGVTSLGQNAFAKCSSLASINIPSSVTSIGSSAFNACYSLASINIPNGVTSIGESAFANCASLASISIPSSVTNIFQYAFQSCSSLASISIPSGVTSINTYTFGYCYSLSSVNISNGVRIIENYAFQACSSLASINIPSSVTSIGNSAFNGCYSLASINIPNGVTSIGNSAFQNCSSLASINIPSSVTSIGISAFASCSSLASVNISNGVTSIGNSAFNACYSLASINIPSSVTSIGNSAFYACYSLASINIPNGVTRIGDGVFQTCYNLTTIYIPSSVTSIEYGAFSGNAGVRFYDFSNHTEVPTLSTTNAFTSITSDCEIRVPTALYNEWITATNWTTYANNIVAV